MASYYTTKQSLVVRVASGTNPTGNIELDKYKLTLTSTTAPVGGYLPAGTYPVTAAKGRDGLQDPRWTFPFGITADQPIQVGTTPDE